MPRANLHGILVHVCRRPARCVCPRAFACLCVRACAAVYGHVWLRRGLCSDASALALAACGPRSVRLGAQLMFRAEQQKSLTSLIQQSTAMRKMETKVRGGRPAHTRRATGHAAHCAGHTNKAWPCRHITDTARPCGTSTQHTHTHTQDCACDMRDAPRCGRA